MANSNYQNTGLIPRALQGGKRGKKKEKRKNIESSQTVISLKKGK